MVRFSSVLTFIYLLLSIFFLMKSSAEFYTSKEESKTFDDVLSENSYLYDQEPPSKLYEEEESILKDEKISDKEIDESDRYDRYNQELTSNLYGEEETDGKRGFRQNHGCEIYFFVILKLITTV